MPEMTARRRRATQSPLDAPRVILITLHASPEYKAAARSRRAGFLAKPSRHGCCSHPRAFPASAD